MTIRKGDRGHLEEEPDADDGHASKSQRADG